MVSTDHISSFVPGPQYETPIEIKMYREMGAGMEENVTEELIDETAKKSSGNIVKLVSGVIEQMN